VLNAAMNHSNSKAFADYLHTVSSREIADLRLRKLTDELDVQAEKLHTSRSIATPTGCPRSASPTPTSTRRAPPAC
jgi:hypothetical protein